MTDHGTYNRYKNGRCRCAECTEANRLYMAEYRDRDKRWRRRHVRTEAELRDALTKPEVFWW